MGPSGSGKSTTMNILGCLDVPTEGEFLFRGHHIERLDRDQRALLRRKYLGFVFQGFNLLSRTSALENVELPLLYRGEARAAQIGRAHVWNPANNADNVWRIVIETQNTYKDIRRVSTTD